MAPVVASKVLAHPVDLDITPSDYEALAELCAEQEDELETAITPADYEALSALCAEQADELEGLYEDVEDLEDKNAAQEQVSDAIQTVLEEDAIYLEVRRFISNPNCLYQSTSQSSCHSHRAISKIRLNS